MDQEPSPGTLVLSAEPELAEDEWREGELPQTSEFVREEIFIEQFGIDPVPRLPDLHEPDGCGLEDEEIVREIRIRVHLPAVVHPLRKSFRLVNRCYGFLPAGHGGSNLLVFPVMVMQYPE